MSNCNGYKNSMNQEDLKPLGLQISVDPVEINKYISQKILESGIGEIITKTVNEKLSNWLYEGYDSPIKRVFEKVVKEEMERQFKLPENQKAIQEAASKHMTPEVLESIVKVSVDKINSSY